MNSDAPFSGGFWESKGGALSGMVSFPRNLFFPKSRLPLA
jgi:hypothetical protein